jgi:putative oxidoreductase
MKTASHIARILLGLIFTVFGLNGFLHFIPLPLPSDVAGQFMGALFVSHYYVAVFAVQVAGGILLLSNRFVPTHRRFIGLDIVSGQQLLGHRAADGP